MSLAFVLLAGLTLGSAVAAVALRNLVHSALCLALALVGLALVYLQLGAEFAGFAQILVYVGAVAVLIVFAILLTRGTEAPRTRINNSPWAGGLIAAALLGMLVWAVASSPRLRTPATPAPELSVRAVGQRLMHENVLPLLALGLLLTAATIGAALIALPDDKIPESPTPDSNSPT